MCYIVQFYGLTPTRPVPSIETVPKKEQLREAEGDKERKRRKKRKEKRERRRRKERKEKRESKGMKWKSPWWWKL